MRNFPPVSLIGAPTDIGAGHLGSRMGPEALRIAGLADALAARIAAAGFRDYFVMPDGDEPNAIALGRFRSEAPAQERARALQAAGFPAQAEPLLPGSAQRWLDVRTAPGFDAQAERVAVGAPQAEPLDCTRLPPPSR